MNKLLMVTSIVATIICWGAYGPVLHRGQLAMDNSRLRAFICVGLAYFVIAVVLPLVLLPVVGEKGTWSVWGTLLSLAAGAAGAVGALGIIMAFNYGGRPVYVMPLVFGGAPVVNAFITIYMARTWREINPVFIAGLILVAVGAVTVLITAPAAHPPTAGHQQAAPPA